MKINRFMKGVSQSPSVYWHDSGNFDEIETALAGGATSITLNPFLTYTALEHDREMWKEKAAPIVAAYKGDKRAQELTKLVCGYYADKLRDIYLQGKPGEGYVCAQVNPNKSGDAAYMIAQAKEYSAVAENICVKLPATKAGLEACEECAALGMNVAMTVGMTVPQAIASAEAIQRGHERAKKNGIKPGFGAAVIMVGRLDDYLRDVNMDNGFGIPEENIILAGVACYKRAISIFEEKGYDAYLMAAAFRGLQQIRELAGSKTMLSVAPKIGSGLAEEEFTQDISERPVPEAVINDLKRMKEFVRAYEPDGMKKEEFITYGAVNRTTFQFIETGWNRIEAYQA